MPVIVTPELSGCFTDICAEVGRIPAFTEELASLHNGLSLGSPSEVTKKSLEELEELVTRAFKDSSLELEKTFPGYARRFRDFYGPIERVSRLSNDAAAKHYLFLDSVLKTIELLKTLKL